MTQDALNGRLAFLTGSAWNPKAQEILHLECGTRLVTDMEVLALAKAPKTSVQWLLTGKEGDLTEAELICVFTPTIPVVHEETGMIADAPPSERTDNDF